MTPKQIQNWKNALGLPLAGDDVIIAMRRLMQRDLDNAERDIQRSAKHEQSKMSGTCKHGVNARHCNMCQKALERKHAEKFFK